MPIFTCNKLASHVGRMAKIVGQHFYKGTLVMVQGVAGDNALRMQQRGAQWISNVPIQFLFDEV